MKNLFSVAGNCALVTGSTRGVSRMIARCLVEAETRIYIIRAMPRHAGGPPRNSRCGDIARPSPQTCPSPTSAPGWRWSSAVARALDILVNNAGVTRGAPLETFGGEDWDRILEVNLNGVFHLTNRVKPDFQADGDHLETWKSDQWRGPKPWPFLPSSRIRCRT
jgi:NAD(P)-dependent dehydrogenase (short-subunit alcohol dehydrogenase family)